MSLLQNVKVSTIWSTTSGTLPGSTGNGGSSGSFGANTVVSTGLDMAGFGGVVFLANLAGSSAAKLSAAFSSASTSAAGSWTLLNSSATVTGSGASTVYETLVLDIAAPTQRYLAAAVGVPTSSALLYNVTAFQYAPHDAPASASTAYFVFGAQSVIGSTA